MEQMYLLEIFIDKVTVFAKEGEESTAAKNLIVKVKFGPNIQFIAKEGQLVTDDREKTDVIEMTESGRRQWSRTLRVGNSYLFPSYPDTVLEILSKFPLEIEVWNDDVTEPPESIYVGVGNMHWHTEFFHYLKESVQPGKVYKPLAIKEIVTLYHECCCSQAGQVTFILRVSALGRTIITEFQQIMKDPERFCFRTDKAPSMFECKRVEGDDPNFCMLGTLYETATLEDPDIVASAQKRIEICTEMQSCGVAGAEGRQGVCEHFDGEEHPKRKKYSLSKIRMGDIVGPCGNANCALAHKVRMYIRNLDSYKAKAGNITTISGKTGTKKVCGLCGCKDDRWHREDCPDKRKSKKVICSGCGGLAQIGNTCDEKVNKHFGTGTTPRQSPAVTPKRTPADTPKSTPGGTPKSSAPASAASSPKPSAPSSAAASPKPSAEGSPKGSKTQTQYVTRVPDYRNAMFRRDYVVEDYYRTIYCSHENIPKKISVDRMNEKNACAYSTNYKIPDKSHDGNKKLTRIDSKNACVYGVETATNYGSRNVVSVYNVCTEVTDDCKCHPIKPSPPCTTFDCNCITELSNIAARKAHKPFCPLYKHKSNCPLTMRNEEEGEKEDDEEEIEPLPYGLPPIQLGPCPVMGRPCSVPDGFARMYKNAALPSQPPSYSDAGKVCCSKEYDRIKKAIKEYMKYEKDHDMRCVNKFNIDTERRCCDKEQALLSLMGRECCGTHKLAIQDKFKKEHK